MITRKFRRRGLSQRAAFTRQWQRTAGVALLAAVAAVVLATTSLAHTRDGVMDPKKTIGAEHRAKRLLKSSIVLWAIASFPQKAAYAAPGFETDDTHYGSATLPLETPDIADINFDVEGHVFTPATAANLRTLLSTKSLGGHNLVPGCTIVLTDLVCYNSAGYELQTFPLVAGASWDNPIFVISSNLGRLPASLDDRWQFDSKLATPHFRNIWNGTPCIDTEPGASGYVFWGIEFDGGSTTGGFTCVRLGGNDPSWVNLPPSGWEPEDGPQPGWDPELPYNYGTPKELSHLADDMAMLQCYASVTDDNNTPHTVELRCKRFLIQSSDLRGDQSGTSDHPISGHQHFDQQALWALYTAGPGLVRNTKMVAPGENFMCGGDDPYFEIIMSDVTFQRCHFYKPLTWCPSHESWDEKYRIQKNSFELKTGKRVLVETSVVENHWDAGLTQPFCIVTKSTNQGGGFTAAETGDVTFRYLRLIRVSGAFGFGGTENTAVSPHDHSVYHCYSPTPLGILNYLSGSRAWAFQVNRKQERMHIEHCTLLRATDVVGGPHYFAYLDSNSTDGPSDLTMRNLIGSFGSHGFWIGEGGQEKGVDAINALPNCSVQAVYLHRPDGASALYTSPHFQLRTSLNDLVQNFVGGNYRPADALIGAGYGGRTPGCNIPMVNAYTKNCASGIWSEA